MVEGAQPAAVADPSSPASPEGPLAPDTRIGIFRLKRFLGEGAMGEVYLAQDTTLGRRVALKLINHRQMSPGGVERFLAEARTTARFNHPHIVTIHALGEHEGRPFLALEFIDGESLRARLSSRPLPEREAMRVVRAVAEAVAEAHRHGVVHADLKPENVMIPADGRVRVVDFGLARILGAPAGGGGGTRAYMPPEAWSGAPPAAATDIWAMGTLLHELIAGRRPFDQAELAMRVFGTAPFELAEAQRRERWAPVVEACLQRDPSRRPTAQDVARRLDELLNPTEAAAAPRGEERSPYLGLATFTRERAADYFGRQAELDAVVEQLRSRVAIPITGPSGIGKSSFVEAALIPRLEESGRWVIVRCRPGALPFESLSRALREHGIEATPAALREHPATLALHLHSIAKAGGGRALLFLDQFEEVYTLASPEDAAALCQGVAAAGDPEEPWRAVLTLRDDYLGRLAAVPEMRPYLGGVLTLAPLTRAELETAVRAPLLRAGYDADAPDLPARIARDVEPQPACLPLLQFSCQALWDRRDATTRKILASEYDAMGGAGGALARHAERLLSQLTPGQISLVRSVFLRLVGPDGTRRPRSRDATLEGLARGASEVVDHLLDHRLLVAHREAETEIAILELAHEALPSAWPLLARWLDESHEERAIVAEIEQAATLWARRGRLDEETWAGEPLAQASRRVREWNIPLRSEPRAFLDAGARREERGRRRRRWLLGGAGSALTILATASAVAAVAFRDKERQAIAQQEQIRLAAGDMGVFDLELSAFDWDADSQSGEAVSPPPPLEWTLRAVAADDSASPGRPYGEDDLRRGERSVDGAIVRERVEARSGQAFLEVRSRGGECPPSLVYLRHLPGYIERASGAAPAVIRIAVPTCKASAAGMIEIPAGPFLHNVDAQGPEKTRDERIDLPAFRMDRTEVTRAAFARYGALESLSGDGAAPAPHLDFSRADAGRLPAVGVNYFTARNYCRFMGKELPSVDQWQKAVRGGLTIGGAPNPAPARVAPWGDELSEDAANLDGKDGFEDLAPVGAFPRDRSPYGVMDLAGNASEWTATGTDIPSLRGLRIVLGGHWGAPVEMRIHQVDARNTRPDRYLDFAIGLRCAAATNETP